MKHITTNMLVFYLIGMTLVLSSSKIQDKKISIPDSQIKSQPKIQGAILMDASNSMDGLIEQARARLWNMVSGKRKAKCGNTSPKIEIALSEYGRSDHNVKDDFVKKLMAFSSDLDSLSQTFFNLKNNGGDEYCG